MNPVFREQPSNRVAYPEDPEELRAVLMGAVSDIAEKIKDTAQESEAGRTLAPAAVEALRASGLAGMKSPREVGATVPEACVLLLVGGKIRVAGNRKPKRHGRG